MQKLLNIEHNFYVTISLNDLITTLLLIDYQETKIKSQLLSKIVKTRLKTAITHKVEIMQIKFLKWKLEVKY